MNLTQMAIVFTSVQESLRRNGVAITVNKRPKCSTWMQSQKQQNDLCFQGKPFNIMVIQVYALTSNAEEAEVEWFCEDLQGLLNIQKRCPSHYRGLECKSRNVLGVTGIFGLGVQNEAGQKLIEFCQEKALVRASTLFQQHKRRLYTWTSPDGQHQNQIDYIRNQR